MKELTKLEAQADAIVDASVSELQKNEALGDLYFLLGGVDAVHTIATNLTSVLIANLQRIRDQKAFVAAGFNRFDDFLDQHPKSPMPYKRFNRLENVMEALGPQTFDLLQGSRISVRTMKQLAAGDIEIDGSEIVVGGSERISIGESQTLKTVVEQLVHDRREALEQLEKEKETTEKQQRQLEQGKADFEELQRNLDALRQGDPLQRQAARVIEMTGELCELAGQQPDTKKSVAGRNIVPVLWAALQQVRKTFGIDMTFEEQPRTSAMTIDALAAEVIGDGSMLDEMEED